MTRILKGLFFLSAGVMLLVSANQVFAEEGQRVDTRQGNQDQRIDQGVGNGQLTHRETRYLMRGQDHIDNMESRFLKDGDLTKTEKVRLHRAQNVQSRHIGRAKHNYRQPR